MGILVLVLLETAYISFILVNADMAIWAGTRSLAGGTDWVAFADRFPPWERWLGRFEVVCYWCAIVLIAMRRRLFLAAYLIAITLRFYFWLRFAGVPVVPSYPGYIVMLNELLTGALIYFAWRRAVFR